MKIVIGNHDLPITSVPDLLKQYQEKFKLCKFGKCDNFYHYNNDAVHFLIINSEEEYPIKRTGPQYNFVESDLKAASSDPSIKWIVVAFHTPMYAALWPTATAMPHLGVYYEQFVINLRESYHPLFDKYGVDLVLQGHSHSYQRTYPLIFDNTSPPSILSSISHNPPLITSNSTDTYVNPKGEIYVTIGTAGIGLDNIGTNGNWITTTRSDDHYFAKVDDDNYGFLDLELNEDRSSLTGIFYSNDLVPEPSGANESRTANVPLFRGFPTMGHEVIDYFTISKS